jgi:hypothetical protein
MLLHATLSSGWVGWNYFNKTTCTCLSLREPIGTSVRLVHPKTRFKNPSGKLFATDHSKAATPRVLIFVNCGICFEIGHFINQVLSSYLLTGCVGRLCPLNVAIPDMHISLLYFHRLSVMFKACFSCV